MPFGSARCSCGAMFKSFEGVSPGRGLHPMYAVCTSLHEPVLCLTVPYMNRCQCRPGKTL
jgi:hypothetical protein